MHERKKTGSELAISTPPLPSSPIAPTPSRVGAFALWVGAFDLDEGPDLGHSFWTSAPTLKAKAPTLRAKALTFKTKAPTFNAKDPTLTAKDPTLKTKDPTLKAKDPTLKAKALTLKAKAPTLNASPSRCPDKVYRRRVEGEVGAAWENRDAVMASTRACEKT